MLTIILAFRVVRVHYIITKLQDHKVRICQRLRLISP